MKTSEAIRIYQGLAALRSKEFPAKVSFALTRNFRKLQPIIEDYDKARMQIIREANGEENPEQPGAYKIASDKVAQVQQQLLDLEEVDNPDIQLNRIKLSDIECYGLSMEAMEALELMIEEEE